MLWSRYQWKAIQTLARKFEVDRYNEYPDLSPLDNIYDTLEKLDIKLENLLAELGEEYFYQFDSELVNAVRGITYSELASISYGLDYNLELRDERELISEENYPHIFFCLVYLPSHKDEGLIRENHGLGYHIHYVVMKRKRQTRTNIVFTFDPSESEVTKHHLYWEYHGSGLKAAPEQYGDRRRNAIYDTSCGFLSKIPKKQFRRPTNSANIFWPL